MTTSSLVACCRYHQRLQLMLLPVLLSIGWLLTRGELTASVVTLTYKIEEELGEGTVIADLAKDANLSHLDASIIANIRFKLISQPPFDLLMDERNGLIINRGRIDREELCPQKDSLGGHLLHLLQAQETSDHSCQFRLDAVITPRSISRVIRVTLIILDVNDNRPRFIPASRRIEIPESTQPGATYALNAAVDEDLPPFSVVRYEVVERNLAGQVGRFGDRSGSKSPQHFDISSSRKDDGSSELKLILTDTLDRETQDRLLLVVTAFDGGDPPLSGALEVFVMVKDANDNDPVFEYEAYEVTVAENTTKGSLVTRVKAIDPDLDDNGLVEYQLDDLTQSKYGHVFEVNRKTGEVLVAGFLDYEVTSVYRLIVAARDNGYPASRSSEAAVVVKVLDVNDNPPVILVNPLQTVESGSIGVLENLDSDSFVAHVAVSDSDSDRNGEFDCSLDHNGYFRLKQTASDGEYQILTKRVLDREERPDYVFKLSCKDHGEPALTSSKLLNIEVVDANDNVPVFQRNEYRIELDENNGANVTLLQVTARDSDAGPNAQVRYSLLAPGGGTGASIGHGDMHLQYFTVDRNSGLVRVIETIDREKLPEFRFSVFACDQGIPQPLCSQASIIVKINDINDESPQFPIQTFSFSVEENSPVGTEVGLITARDNDLPPHDYFTFELLPSQDLNPNASKESENQNCRDKGRCRSGSPPSHPTDFFILDPKSGQLVTNAVLDREDTDVHHFTVEATDIENPKLKRSASVYVYVMDQNDNDPVWLEPKWTRESTTERNLTSSAGEPQFLPPVVHPTGNDSGYMPTVILPLYRHSKPGTIVTRFKVSDRDAGSNAQVVYRVDYSQPKHGDLFRVDNRTGALVVSSSLKRLPSNATVTLVATATDRGIPPRSSSLRIMMELHETYRFSDHFHSDPRHDYTDEGTGSGFGEYIRGDISLFSMDSLETVILASACVGVFGVVLILLSVAFCLLVQNRRRRRKLEKDKQSTVKQQQQQLQVQQQQQRQQLTFKHGHNNQQLQQQQQQQQLKQIKNKTFTTFQPAVIENGPLKSRLSIRPRPSAPDAFGCHGNALKAEESHLFEGTICNYMPSKNSPSPPLRNQIDLLEGEFKSTCAALAAADAGFSRFRLLNNGSPYCGDLDKVVPKVDYCAGFSASGGGVLFGERSSPAELYKKSDSMTRLTPKNSFATNIVK